MSGCSVWRWEEKSSCSHLEDSHLQELTIDISSRMHMTFAFAPHQFDQSLQALEATAATVNKARGQKGLPAIHTSFCER